MASNRDERMNEITERLEKGVQEVFTSERYTQYLKTMSQFHSYSFNNTLLIAAQKPDATHVAGYQAWQKKFNRQVKRGEKGIQIISPAPVKEKEMREKVDKKTGEPILGPDGQPEMEEVVKVIPKFKMATVFDVSQTFGEPLPNLGVEEMTASVDNYESFMRAIELVSPVPIRFDSISNGAKGYYDNVSKEIVIQQDMSESQTLKTAIHETAHAILHDRDFMKDQGIQKDQLTRECEAESVAFTVCQNFGIDMSDYSFPYIASWSSSKELKELRYSMDTIRHTSSEMIDGITEAVKTMEREQEWTAIRENEALLFTDSQPRYAIYQIEGDNAYKFMNTEFVQNHDMTVKGDDYDLVYSGKLEPSETLDSIYAKFNAEHPNDFAGHSLSVSDVVVMVNDGEAKAYYVDSIGFTELPNFVQERTSAFEQKVMEAYEEMEEDFVPIYTQTGSYAHEHGELEEYRQSKSENIACKEAIEKAISDNFDGMHLNPDAVEPVIEEFGEERVAFVLASTIQVKDWDGRFSQSNKEWAASVPTLAEINPDNDVRTEWAVQSHPAVLDGFVDMFRESLENTREVEIESVVNDVEIAFHLNEEDRYFAIQTASYGGYDYTFYDNSFNVIDGGILDKPDISMREAIEEIFSDVGISILSENLTSMDYGDLLDKVYLAERIEAIPPISDRTESEVSLQGKSMADIEETVLSYAQAQIDEMGLHDDVQLHGARVYGSRTREGLYSEQSDIDVVISYSGNIREDDFFNMLHEEGFSFAGIPVDINPISTEKTGSLEDYLKIAEEYLDEKEAKQKSQPEKSVKRRESVVQALRDRQSKLKEQETEKPKQKTQTHKKGDHEL